MTQSTWGTESGGVLDDRVRLVLGQEEVRTCERYSVETSILQQPAAFSITVSATGGTADLLKRYKPGTRFQLFIGPHPQFTGRIDGYTTNGEAGSTSITFKGRDELAALFDHDVEAEKHFTNLTYPQLVKTAMLECGLGPRVLKDNGGNRDIRSGVKVSTIKEPPKVEQVVQSAAPGKGAVKHVVTAKLGESWLDFVRRHIAKAGLCIWADHEGNFVLSTPWKWQEATYRFVRQRGQLRNACNVELASFTNDTTRRYSEVVIYLRNGGRKSGRGKIHDGFVDDEMVQLGFKKKKIFRDVNVTTAEQAERYARRMIGEANRAGWQLEYKVSGHVAPSLVKGKFAVVVPDTICELKDDENSLEGRFYIEKVRYESPPRQSIVTLMRVDDLVFGED